MEQYNFERKNQEKRCLGKIPFKNFIEGVKLYNNLVYEDDEGAGATQNSPICNDFKIVEVLQEQEKFLQ